MNCGIMCNHNQTRPHSLRQESIHDQRKLRAGHLETALLHVLQLVLLQVQLDLGAAAEGLPAVPRNREAAARLRLPDVLCTAHSNPSKSSIIKCVSHLWHRPGYK